MGFGKKKTLLDQAGEYVDAARPHVEAAIENARDFVQDTAIPALNDAKEKAGTGASPTPRRRPAPVIADAKEKAAPIIASGAALAAEKATAAKDAADAKVSELKPQPKKKSKLKRFLLFGAIAGGVAAVAKKLQAGSSSDNWQSSYTPSPPPTEQPPTPPTPAAPQSGGDPLTDPLPEDPGGASPDEAHGRLRRGPAPGDHAGRPGRGRRPRRGQEEVAGYGLTAAAWDVDPAVDLLPPAEQPVDPALAVGRDVLARTPATSASPAACPSAARARRRRPSAGGRVRCARPGRRRRRARRPGPR